MAHPRFLGKSRLSALSSSNPHVADGAGKAGIFTLPVWMPQQYFQRRIDQAVEPLAETNRGGPMWKLFKGVQVNLLDEIPQAQGAPHLRLGVRIALDPAAGALAQPFFVKRQRHAERPVVAIVHGHCKRTEIGVLRRHDFVLESQVALKLLRGLGIGMLLVGFDSSQELAQAAFEGQVQDLAPFAGK